jgi:ABC-type glycerol-3-phosphate transport system permease component
MPALMSVWLSLASLLLAAAMVLHRPLWNDYTVTLVLYFGSPGSLCLAGLVLWSLRREDPAEPGIAGQRRQAKIAMAQAVLAAAIVYALVIFAERRQAVSVASASESFSGNTARISLS